MLVPKRIAHSLQELGTGSHHRGQLLQAAWVALRMVVKHLLRAHHHLETALQRQSNEVLQFQPRIAKPAWTQMFAVTWRWKRTRSSSARRMKRTNKCARTRKLTMLLFLGQKLQWQSKSLVVMVEAPKTHDITRIELLQVFLYQIELVNSHKAHCVELKRSDHLPRLHRRLPT